MSSASRSSFFGFEIAKTGLFINQHNLNITGHNISNANTVGYTRQRLVTSAIEPYSSVGRLGSFENGILGGGTRSHYIEQLRSDYLDREFRMQNSATNTWESRLQGLEFVEQIFVEPNEVGIISHLQEFRNALNDLATKSTGEEHRAALQSAGKLLCDSFNQYYRQLVDQQSNLNKEIKTKVNQVNDYADRIGELNKLIYNFEMTGESANDLRDQRNVLLDELSSLVDIEVEEYRLPDHEPARLCVSIGEGNSMGDLVNHDEVNHLATEKTASVDIANMIEDDADNVTGHPDATLMAIMWDASYYSSRTAAPTDNIEGSVTTSYGNPPTEAEMRRMYALVGEGEIKGTLTLRDGNDSTNIGIPYLVRQLDTLARAVVTEFNAVHNSGYCDSRAPGGSQSGIDFFDDYDNDPSKITAGTFKLDDAITRLEDVWRIACSDVPVTSLTEGNNINTVKEMLGLFDDENVPVVGNFSDFYNSFLIAIGTTTKFARTQHTSSTVLAASLDTQRLSISSVSIDEEMTNMIKFQHAFAASSRVITAMDEALDRVINSTGVVGR